MTNRAGADTAGQSVQGAPFGRIESIGTEIRGWAIDPESLEEGAQVELLFDSRPVVTSGTSVARPDLVPPTSAANPSIGFAIDLIGLIHERAGASRGGLLPRTISLAVRGQVIDELQIPEISRIAGRLEGLQDGALSGWIELPLRNDVAVEIEILIDGIRLGTAHTDRLRGTEVHTDKRTFQFPLTSSPSLQETLAAEARLPIFRTTLENCPLTLSLPPNARLGQHVRRALSADKSHGVVIIVAIFNAPWELRRCLTALFANTTGSAGLILVDDASTDPQTRQILVSIESMPRVRIVRRTRNGGFAAAVNSALDLGGDSDIVLLNSDAIVPQRWLENLRIAAYAHPAIGTVTPFSDNANAFSAPQPDTSSPTPSDMTFEALARRVRQESLGLFPDAPFANGFCMYVKRAVLTEMGALDEDAFSCGYGADIDFSLRASRLGWRHVVDDRTFVKHTPSASFGDPRRLELSQRALALLEARYPDYRCLVECFARSQDMLIARHRVRRAFAAASVEAPTRPRLLTVISTTTGGTPLTNLDLARALATDHDVYLLGSDSRQLILSQLVGDDFIVIATRWLDTPITLSRHLSAAYDDCVAEWLVKFAIDFVHIRHIAWHGFGLTWVCHELGIPVIFSFHDYYLVCPTVKLLDEKLRFCGGECTAGKGPCFSELWYARETPELKHRWVYTWRELTSALVEPVDAFVTTSKAAFETIARCFPSLRDRAFKIIPHGRDFAGFRRSAAPPQPGEVIRLLVPGNLSPAKGAGILADLKTLDLDDRLEIHVLGDHRRAYQGGNIIFHGEYRRDQFLDLAEQIRPHFGLILSLWAETYCHTLTELWAAGVPVIAFDMGAVGERIREHGAGHLLTDMNAKSVFNAVMSISADLDSYHSLLTAVMEWQERSGAREDTENMGNAYRRLYAEALGARRSLLRT